MKSFLTHIILLMILWANLLSNENTIIADRPGFSTGTHTLERGKFNIELGYNYDFYKSSNTQSLPLVVLRTGVTPKIELNILWDGWSFDNSQKSETTMSDLTLGGKYRIYESSLYNLTFMGLLTLPSPLKLDNTVPLIGLLWDYSISDKTSLFGTCQTSSYKENTNRIYDAQVALGLSLSHTNEFGSFIEVYSIIPSQTYIDTEAVINGGFTYLLNNNVQFDINLGVGLNSQSHNFVGCGIAMQF